MTGPPCRQGSCWKKITMSPLCGRSSVCICLCLILFQRQISDAVRQAGNSSQEYDEFVSRTREGDKRHKIVNTIAEIQRQVIALDLHGLFAELDKLTALESLERRSQGCTSSLQMTSLAAHLAVYFKTMLFIQGGQTLSSKGADPEKSSWHAELVDILRKIDLVGGF